MTQDFPKLALVMIVTHTCLPIKTGRWEFFSYSNHYDNNMTFYIWPKKVSLGMVIKICFCIFTHV